MKNLLSEAREIINKTDKEMARLFEERMNAAVLVAKYKRENGLPILDPEREREVIIRNSEFIENDEIRAYYVNFMEEVMKISRSYQTKLNEGMKVAYSGVEGAFAHIAASRLFPSAKKIGYHSFEDAYRSVEVGECDAVVLPIENSTGGEVGQVSDLIFSGSLFVNGMTEIRVTQDLLVKKGTSLSEIKEVISHPQALTQCREFIKKHGFATHEFENTATAAKFVAECDNRSIAAIASKEAADIYGLEVIESAINSASQNSTRFVILSRSEKRSSERSKSATTLLLFTVRNEAGSLAKAIDVIGKHGFNLKSLRSRPMKDLLWQYYFYAEAEGNLNTPEGQEMMAELSEYCDKLKSAGTFIKS